MATLQKEMDLVGDGYSPRNGTSNPGTSNPGTSNPGPGSTISDSSIHPGSNRGDTSTNPVSASSTALDRPAGAAATASASAPAPALAFGSGSGSGSSSGRVSRACQPCNRQKLRCDGLRPCGRCVRLRQGEGCEYVQSMRGRVRRKRRKVESEQAGEEEREEGGVGPQAEKDRDRQRERETEGEGDEEGEEEREEVGRWIGADGEGRVDIISGVGKVGKVNVSTVGDVHKAREGQRPRHRAATAAGRMADGFTGVNHVPDDPVLPGSWDTWKADQRAGRAGPGNSTLWGRSSRSAGGGNGSGTSHAGGEQAPSDEDALPLNGDASERSPLLVKQHDHQTQTPETLQANLSKLAARPPAARPPAARLPAVLSRSTTRLKSPTDDGDDENRIGGTSTDLRDRLTTLPLPGDARNPLAVLAEASASAHLSGRKDKLEELDELDDSDEDAITGVANINGPSRARTPGAIAVTPAVGRRASVRTPSISPLISVGERLDEAHPSGLSARTRAHAHDETDDVYYAPLERVLKEEAPHIMRFLNVREAESLFQLYFAHLHAHLPVLDRAHSSPSDVARRNNFLFNAICCVSAFHFRPALWKRLEQFAAFEVERLPREKNIDVVQGHLVYAAWNLSNPTRFEADQTWLRAGLAIRTALDINLHRVALMPGFGGAAGQRIDGGMGRTQMQRSGVSGMGVPDWLARAILRTWLMCYVTDGTLSAQLGKPISGSGSGSGMGAGEAGVGRYIRLLRDLARDRLCHKERPGMAVQEVETEAEAGIGWRRMEEDVALDLWVAAWAEWTQILTRATEMFRSELQVQAQAHSQAQSRSRSRPGPRSERHSVDEEATADYWSARPDLCRLFTDQLSEWARSAAESLATLDLDEGYLAGLTVRIGMYEGYARLVLASYGLQQAELVGPSDRERKMRLQVAFAHYMSACIRLVEVFVPPEPSTATPASSSDASRARAGEILLGRGAPDFHSTCLTYGTVSLLKCLSAPYAQLLPEQNTSLGSRPPGTGASGDHGKRKEAILALAHRATQALALSDDPADPQWQGNEKLDEQAAGTEEEFRPAQKQGRGQAGFLLRLIRAASRKQDRRKFVSDGERQSKRTRREGSRGTAVAVSPEQGVGEEPDGSPVGFPPGALQLEAMPPSSSVLPRLTDRLDTFWDHETPSFSPGFTSMQTSLGPPAQEHFPVSISIENPMTTLNSASDANRNPKPIPPDLINQAGPSSGGPRTRPTDLDSFVSMLNAGLDPYGLNLGPGFGITSGSGFGLGMGFGAEADPMRQAENPSAENPSISWTAQNGAPEVFGTWPAMPSGGFLDGFETAGSVTVGRDIKSWVGDGTTRSRGLMPRGEDENAHAQRGTGWEDDALWRAVMHGAGQAPADGMV